MADRTLRGSRLGQTTFEGMLDAEPAPRQVVAYECARHHRVEVPFSVEAEVPDTWECPRCSNEALRVGHVQPQRADEKPVRTHWDMLLERRSEKELEDILKERLELLRGGVIGPAHLHRANKKKRVS
jgi:RNA polymerase binding protein RbpA